ncbi:hypothetical protein F5148DRAFT_1252653 [Russula earlei]|uniref:Uncharacterized protein n=1 Tax=Russula earlei TaxID=71964 RepID=A0ACC0TTZ4_9AGAM|nr:hypothetical protein F5148DRAFT_1252653 [Russula earlei]
MRTSSIFVIFCLAIGVAPSLALAMPGVNKTLRGGKEMKPSRKKISSADRRDKPKILEATRVAYGSHLPLPGDRGNDWNQPSSPPSQ